MRADASCIPNPWDIGSARYLQDLGFKALASTSAGFAFTHGWPDGAVPRDMMLAHLRELSPATDVPLNADFEGGYARRSGWRRRKRAAVLSRPASPGLSIEDSTGNPDKPLYDFDLAVARVRAARAAIDKAGGDVLFTARSRRFPASAVPISTRRSARLKAYADAGADCLYAPGIKTQEQIEAVVKAVAPKPVNFLMAASEPFTVADLATTRRTPHQRRRHARARRLGPASCAPCKRSQPREAFASFAGTIAHAELNAFFRDDMKRRSAMTSVGPKMRPVDHDAPATRERPAT